MKKFKGNVTQFTAMVDDKKLVIEIPIKTLAYGFNFAPDNVEEIKIRKGKRQAFAEFIAKHLDDEIDSETGATFITAMFDKMFGEITDGNYDLPDIIKYPEDE